MDKTDVKKIAVIGTGTMGPGIAQVLARYGVNVRIYDIDPARLQNARTTLDGYLKLMCSEGFIPEAEISAILDRVEDAPNLEGAVKGADLVLEVIPEVFDLKAGLFEKLDTLCDESTILASNTSGLSITALANSTRRPEKVVGMHWWNPPIIIPVIEIIRGRETEDATVRTVEALTHKINKIPVLVKKDVPGFLGNRLQYALMREAIALLDEGVASAEDIDTMIKAGIGFKFPVMGPLETIDMAGLDIYDRVSQYLYKNLNNSQDPPAIIKEKVERKEFGLKTGQGFYSYSNIDAKDLMEQRVRKLMVLLRDLGYE
jgi:3-hydroxyacyl-CoA dehydrogenase